MAALVATVWFIDKGPILSPPNPRAEAAGVVGMSARQVSTDLFDFRGSPFPDGKRIAYTDWGGSRGELAVRDLESDEKRMLTQRGAGEFAYYSVVSPDGKEVAFSAFMGKRWDLRVISVEVDEPHKTERVLVRGGGTNGMDYIQPFAWTPNSRRVLMLGSAGDSARIALVSADNGEVTVVKSLGWRWPEHLSMSPDGRWIAYDVPVRDDSPDKDIFPLAVDGSRETALIQRKGLDYGPIWTPDGSEVLFASDRGGSIGLWSVAVADGKSRGPVRLVKPGTGRILPVGMTAGGALFYGILSSQEDVYVTELAPETRQALQPPKLATDRFVGFNFAPMWSPDGKRLAFFSRRRGVSVNPTPGSLTLVVQSLQNGEETEQVVPFVRVAHGRWFPDGRSLLVPARNKRNRWFLYRVNAETGNSEALTGPITTEFRFPRPVVSPDGNTVYYIGWDEDWKPTETESFVIALDLATGKTRELHRVRPPWRMMSVAMSPDGARLAFLTVRLNFRDWNDREAILSSMPVAGDETREMCRIEDYPDGWVDHGTEWTRDGQHVILPLSGGAEKGYGAKWDLIRIPAKGGPAESLGLAGAGADPVRFPMAHPDGRQIAFDSSTWGELGRELWVLENFLPKQPKTD